MINAQWRDLHFGGLPSLQGFASLSLKEWAGRGVDWSVSVVGMGGVAGVSVGRGLFWTLLGPGSSPSTRLCSEAQESDWVATGEGGGAGMGVRLGEAMCCTQAWGSGLGTKT